MESSWAGKGTVGVPGGQRSVVRDVGVGGLPALTSLGLIRLVSHAVIPLAELSWE